METKRYDVREAAALIAVSDGSEQAVRDALTMTTDIPADRLEAAIGETMQMVEPLQGLATMYRMALGRAVTSAELLQGFREMFWVDDNLKTSTINITVADEEGNEQATATINTKLQ